MPRGNGTGPAGYGAMTGRRAGFCAGYSMPGYANPAGGRGFFGRGRGPGSGRGRGFRNRFYAAWGPHWDGPGYYERPFTNEEELNILKEEAKYMQDEMNSINDRINEIEKSGSPKKEK